MQAEALGSLLADGCQAGGGSGGEGPARLCLPEAAGDSGSSCLWEEGVLGWGAGSCGAASGPDSPSALSPAPSSPRAAALTANPSAWSTPLVSPQDPPKAAVNVQGRSWPPPKTKGGSRAREDRAGPRARPSGQPAPPAGSWGPTARSAPSPTRGDVLRPRKPLAPQSGPRAASGALGAWGGDPRERGGQVWGRSGWHVPRLTGSPPFPPAPPALSYKSGVSEPRPPLTRPSRASSPALPFGNRGGSAPSGWQSGCRLADRRNLPGSAWTSGLDPRTSAAQRSGDARRPFARCAPAALPQPPHLRARAGPGGRRGAQIGEKPDFSSQFGQSRPPQSRWELIPPGGASASGRQGGGTAWWAGGRSGALRGAVPAGLGLRPCSHPSSCSPAPAPAPPNLSTQPPGDRIQPENCLGVQGRPPTRQHSLEAGFVPPAAWDTARACGIALCWPCPALPLPSDWDPVARPGLTSPHPQSGPATSRRVSDRVVTAEPGAPDQL